MKILTTADLAQEIRSYVSRIYPDCEFAVIPHYGGMSASINVALTAGPYPAFRDPAAVQFASLNRYDLGAETQLTEWAMEVMSDLNNQIIAWRGCAGMIHVGNVATWYDLSVGRWDCTYDVKPA